MTQGHYETMCDNSRSRMDWNIPMNLYLSSTLGQHLHHGRPQNSTCQRVNQDIYMWSCCRGITGKHDTITTCSFFITALWWMENRYTCTCKKLLQTCRHKNSSWQERFINRNVICYTIFCHLFHIHSRKTGNLFSLLFHSLWWVQIVGHVLACRSYSFVCTLHHHHHSVNLSEDIELIECLSNIFCRVCE